MQNDLVAVELLKRMVASPWSAGRAEVHVAGIALPAVAIDLRLRTRVATEKGAVDAVAEVSAVVGHDLMSRCDVDIDVSWMVGCGLCKLVLYISLMILV